MKSMVDNGTLNYAWSQTMIAGFIAAGISEAVISPGSRSTPLALAMLRRPQLRCQVVIDERSAAFFALGIAKASRRPVLLLATSGTAPANWLPAVIEASQSGIPLILISADRPPEQQACGANQTIEQLSLFGSHVRARYALGTPEDGFNPDYLHKLAAHACEQANWPHPGPVHINQPFREPLIPANQPDIAGIPENIRTSPPHQLPAEADIRDLANRISGRPGIIVCGETPTDKASCQSISALANRLNCPVLAEPLSGMRFGEHDRSHLAVNYNSWLGDQDFVSKHRPDWVLRLGAFPVTRHLQNYVAGVTGIHALIEPWSRWTDPAHRLTHVLRTEVIDACTALMAEPLLSAPDSWFQVFAQQELLAPKHLDPGHIGVLLDEAPAEMPIFVGNSLAIRQLDTLSGESNKAIHFHGNRGASGIDGNISTALGISAVHGRVIALLGDLTCQHDLGGLALAQGSDAVIIVINNGGGGIFDLLPQHDLPEFELGWRTPQQINFQYAAKTFNITYGYAETNQAFRSELRKALKTGGPHLIELKLP